MQRWYLCPFKMKSLVHPVLFPSLFSFPSSPHPFPPTSWWWSLHFYVFKLWRCCIRYTVILNEQWEWVFFLFCLFLVFYFLWDSFESDSLWSLMKCTAHLCLWNQECILVCTYACVCEFVCLNQSWTLKSMSSENKVIHVFVCKLTLIWSKQHWVCLHADL